MNYNELYVIYIYMWFILRGTNVIHLYNKVASMAFI